MVNDSTSATTMITNVVIESTGLGGSPSSRIPGVAATRQAATVRVRLLSAMVPMYSTSVLSPSRDPDTSAVGTGNTTTVRAQIIRQRVTIRSCTTTVRTMLC